MILKPDYIEHMHRNLIPEVILKGDFYIAHKRHCRVSFQRDFMARNQPLLETETFKKSDTNFYVMKILSDLNCVQLVKLHLLREFEFAIWRAGVSRWCQRHSPLWFLASSVTVFLASESLQSAPACSHGCVPGSGPVFIGWWDCTRLYWHFLCELLLWHGVDWDGFICNLTLELWKPTCFNILKLLLLKEWKYISIDNNYCWQVIVIWIHQSYKNV